MEIYVKLVLFSIFSLFWFSITVLSYTLILYPGRKPIGLSQIQTETDDVTN